MLRALTSNYAVGLKLPSEELMGQQPSPCQQLDRAYMSNVCTAKAAQRQVQELCTPGKPSCMQPVLKVQPVLSLYPHSACSAAQGVATQLVQAAEAEAARQGRTYRFLPVLCSIAKRHAMMASACCMSWLCLRRL